MISNNFDLKKLKEHIYNYNNTNSSLSNLENQLEYFKTNKINYIKILKESENEIDGFVNGYLILEIKEGEFLIPFYQVNEVNPIILKKPRKFDKNENLIYFDELKKEIQEKAKELKTLYNLLK